jgi:hypothetical protein
VRAVDALKPYGTEFTVWDEAVTGFGVRVRPIGSKSYVVVYRAGAGRGAPVRRYTIAAVGKIAPERARVILGSGRMGTILLTRRSRSAAFRPRPTS